MPRPAEIPPALDGRVFRGSVAVKQGLLTPAQLRSSAWRQVRRDVYVDARVPVNHGLALAAAALVLPPRSLIAGRSAAWLYGVRHAQPDDPVDAIVPREFARRAPAGIAVRVDDVPSADATRLGKRRVTTAARTCIDVARWHDVLVAVPIIDAMLAARQVREIELQVQFAAATDPGSGQAQQALALCDGRAESPPESVLRVRLILAGLPAPVPQHEVWLGGQFVARVDLGWPELKVAVEYDGAWHGAPGQLGKDRRRLNALIAAGWTVIHVTAADLHSLTPVIEQLRSLLRRGAARDGS